ncbi:MAG: 6-pyruvoyl-tetrahydropterin synthase-related protein [Acidobacteriota bacterium]
MTREIPFRIGPLDAILILCVASFSILPVLVIGPPVGTADLVHHLQIANAYSMAFESGHFIPDWVAAENQGYGAVTVRFYPPLMHMSIAAFHLVTGKWHLAVFAAFTMWSFTGGWGVFLWTRDILNSRSAAIAAACVFAFSPYHLNQFYNSFMWGEFAALSVLPFVFLFARRVCSDGSIINAVSLGISISLLILGNLPQTVIGLVCVGIYTLFAVKKETIVRQAIALSAACVAGAALSAFYWVRVAYEANWINVSQPNNDPAYYFGNHFLLNGLEFDAQSLWFATLMLLASVAGAVIALLVSGGYRAIRSNREIRALTVIGSVAVFLLLPVSRLMWEYVTPLQRVQFPWRFLSVVSLITSVLIGYSICIVIDGTFRVRRPAKLVITGVVLIFATFAVKQVILGAFTTTADAFDDLPSRSLSSNGLPHWRPVWSSDDTFKVDKKVIAAERSLSIRRWDSLDREFDINDGSSVELRTAILYYPHWKATVNGEAAETSSVDGALGLKIGSQSSNIALQFVEPEYTYISRLISLIAWAAAAFAIAWEIFDRNKSQHIEINE